MSKEKSVNRIQEQKMAGGYTEGPSEDKKDPIRVTAVKIERKTSINNVSKMLSHRIFD